MLLQVSYPLGGVVPFALADCRNDEVAVGGTDNQIAIWNLKKQTVRKVFQGHTGSVTSLDYISRADGLGGIVVSGSFDTSVRTWPLGPVNPVRVRVSEKSPASLSKYPMKKFTTTLKSILRRDPQLRRQLIVARLVDTNYWKHAAYLLRMYCNLGLSIPRMILVRMPVAIRLRLHLLMEFPTLS